MKDSKLDFNKSYRHVSWMGKSGYSCHGALIKENCGIFFKYSLIYSKGKLVKVKVPLEYLDYRSLKSL